jgi:hypothetical protein
MSETSAYEFFSKLEEQPYVELNESSAKVLKGVLSGDVVQQALANVLKIATTEDISFKTLNYLTDPMAIEVALRKQGQIKGLVLAIENLIEQAYAYEEEETNGSTEEE